jgi:hypothetical protein
MSHAAPVFVPQIITSDVPRLVASYLATEGAKDEKALDAGKGIAGGCYSRENLEVIFRWKTGGRGVSRLSRNTDAEIADALRLSAAASTERAAIAVLCGLDGVDVPVASAVMTNIKPDQFTVIDFRALEALGVKTSDRSLCFYLAYLSKCRELARELGMSLRDLDRALWQWSKHHGASGSD